MKKEDVCCLYLKKVISFLTYIKNKHLCANVIALYRKILPAQLRTDKIPLVYYISL